MGGSKQTTLVLVALIVLMCLTLTQNTSKQERLANEISSQVELIAQNTSKVTTSKQEERLANGISSQVEPATHSTLPECMRMDDMTDGTLINATNGDPLWKPNTCKLNYLSEKEQATCLAGKTIVFIGDSHVRNLARQFANVSVMHQDDFLQNYPSDMPTLSNWWTLDYHSINLCRDGTDSCSVHLVKYVSVNSRAWILREPYLSLIKRADVIVINNGLWELAPGWCGATTFFTRLKTLLTRMRSFMKPDAQLIMKPLHWIHHGHPKCIKKCKECNHPPKVAVYREAQILAAACTGTDIFDESQFKKKCWDYARDGAHYFPVINAISANMLMHLMCKGGSEAFSAPPRCKEVAAKRRWRENPAANNINCEAGFHHPPEGCTVPIYEECQSLSDSMPGTLLTKPLLWEGNNCTVKTLTAKPIAKCLEKKRIVILGDFNGRNLIDGMIHRGMLSADVAEVEFQTGTSPLTDRIISDFHCANASCSLSYIGYPSVGVSPWFLSHPKAVERITGADLVVFSSGALDTNTGFCGPQNYYHRAKSIVQSLKAMMMPSSALVLKPLHHVNDSCEGASSSSSSSSSSTQQSDGLLAIGANAGECVGCNHPAKVAVYREALSMIAGCVPGVSLFDDFAMKRQANIVSPGQLGASDGVNYPPETEGLSANLLFSAYCGSMSLSRPHRCEEEAAHLRWSTFPKANALGCQPKAMVNQTECRSRLDSNTDFG